MGKTVWIDYDPNAVDLSCLFRRFEAEGYQVIAEAVRDFNDEEDIIRHALQADAVGGQGAAKGKVQIIVRFGVGVNGIDIPWATKVGIPVGNIAGANSAAVAEIALLHILNCNRRFTHCAEGVRGGIWPSSLLGNELDGKTVGLFGLGNIARQLVRMLSGFHVNILAYDPYVDPASAPQGAVIVSTVEELFSRSDIVSLHVPLTQQTEGIIDAHLFELMKPTAYLVNTCRGAVVMDNLTVTSHLGANAWESDMRGEDMIADTIIGFFNGQHPANILNKEVFR